MLPDPHAAAPPVPASSPHTSADSTINPLPLKQRQGCRPLRTPHCQATPDFDDPASLPASRHLAPGLRLWTGSELPPANPSLRLIGSATRRGCCSSQTWPRPVQWTCHCSPEPPLGVVGCHMASCLLQAFRASHRPEAAHGHWSPTMPCSTQLSLPGEGLPLLSCGPPLRDLLNSPPRRLVISPVTCSQDLLAPSSCPFVPLPPASPTATTASQVLGPPTAWRWGGSPRSERASSQIARPSPT